MPSLAALAAPILLAACSSNDLRLNDAAIRNDAAAAASVRTITCPPDPNPPAIATTESNNASFVPDSLSISQGGFVKFIMSPSHNVMPDPAAASDPGLVVPMGGTACLEFDKPGTYSFMCAVHRFTGQVMVAAP